MANLTIEIPDELARRLDKIAAEQHRSVQELALERLRSFVETSVEHQPGSAAAVLHAMRHLVSMPHRSMNWKLP